MSITNFINVKKLYFSWRIGQDIGNSEGQSLYYKEELGPVEQYSPKPASIGPELPGGSPCSTFIPPQVCPLPVLGALFRGQMTSVCTADACTFRGCHVVLCLLGTGWVSYNPLSCSQLLHLCCSWSQSSTADKPVPSLALISAVVICCLAQAMMSGSLINDFISSTVM